MTETILEYYWEDDTTLVLTTNVGTYRLTGVYLSGMKIEGLDYSSSEEVTIELTQKYDTR